jgi:hypothetical protein
MRIAIRETKVYKFNELPKDAQQKAIEKFRETNLDYEWYDYVYDDFKTLCALMGITVDKIYFSGFWSQGDGACFEGSYNYKADAIQAVKDHAPQDKELHSIVSTLQGIQKETANSLFLTVKHLGHYYHYNCTDFNVDRNDAVDLTDAQEKGIIEAFKDLMKWLYRTLNQEYDYLQSDEAIKETFDCND